MAIYFLGCFISINVWNIILYKQWYRGEDIDNGHIFQVIFETVLWPVLFPILLITLLFIKILNPIVLKGRKKNDIYPWI